MNAPSASQDQIERRKIDADTLWSLTGLPPRTACTGLGLSSEALGYLNDIYATLSVLANSFQRAPVGDSALRFTIGVIVRDEKGVGSEIVPKAAIRFEVSPHHFGHVKPSLRARVEEWCREATGALVDVKVATLLWSLSGLNEMPFAATKWVSSQDMEMAALRLRQAVPSKPLRAQIDAAVQAFNLDGGLPDPVVPSARRRM